MKVYVFASSSKGNCLLLRGEETNILIDAGISMRRIVSALASAGLSVGDIGGVLITHEHSDHISGLRMLLKHHKLSVYAPRTLAARLRGCVPECEDNIHIIPTERPFAIGGLEICAYHTSHDVDESVCYRVTEKGRCFALATDTGIVTEGVRSCLHGADTVLIESNHDEKMLLDGPYPAYLKRRILSDRGHLSNESCAALVPWLAGSGTAKIILGHLSQENNCPALALDTCGKALAGFDTALYCAPVFGCLEVDTDA